MSAVSVSQLTKKYSGNAQIDAVIDVSFEVEPGEFLAIVGRSGSGKSTLLAMTGGICRPSGGVIKIGATAIWQQNAHQLAGFRNATIGYVFQFAGLLSALRAVDNVALPALVSGLLKEKEAYARARALLVRVGLAERIDSYPGELSGGEQRRVAIARALINSPSVLLADEPTADLDGETESEILQLLVEIRRAFNLTLIVVTHNQEIAALADRVLTMTAGRAEVQSCSPQSDSGAEKPAQLLDLGNTVKSIFAISAGEVAKEKVQLGLGVDKLVGRMVLLLIPLLSLLYIANLCLANYQQSVVNARLDQRQALEDLANSDLNAGVRDIEMTAGGGYVLTIFLRNTKPEKAMFLMKPVVRLFIQVGSSWQEINLKALNNSPAAVSALTGERLLKFALKPDVPGYSQLIPYYLHARISNDMLVSESSQPKDDLVERNDSYYVYLKPHDVDDATISKKLKFAEKPPVFIGMPPH